MGKKSKSAKKRTITNEVSNPLQSEISNNNSIEMLNVEANNSDIITDSPVEITLNEQNNQNDNLDASIVEEFESDVVFEYNDDTVVEQANEHYKYTEIDCLDEDTPLPGQQFVLMSFISPERIMNCDMRGIKIRGIFPTREKADKALEVMKKKDKYFDIFLGEVGKWLPWNPGMHQVEEVKYRNKKLDKIMGKVHKTELETLNELVGRRKEQLDKDKVAHKDRIKNSVKEAVRTYESENKDEPVKEKEVEKKQKEKATAQTQSRQRDPEAIKQRLRKTLEKRDEARAILSSNKNKETDKEVQEKVDELKTTTAEIAGKLQKMKEFRDSRTK
jgi:hypothetical protein